jgi:septum formation protein
VAILYDIKKEMFDIKLTTIKPLILASASPRRFELLSLLEVPFQVKTIDVDETSIFGKTPAEKVCNTAMAKGLPVSELYGDSIVISADTIVFLNEEPLFKPENNQVATEYLKKLSGKTHTVYTGVSIFYSGKRHQFFEKTSVQFYSLSDEWIQAYVESGEGADKAGAYGIQGAGGLFVEKILGDYHNVVGLPIGKLFQELSALRLISVGGGGFIREN